jgi:hypothetical protein
VDRQLRTSDGKSASELAREKNHPDLAGWLSVV